MIKLLGILDIIAAVVLISKFFNIPFPKQILIFFALYLLIKGAIFFQYIASWIDILAGILVIFLLFNFSFAFIKPAELIFTFLLLQKGLFSLVS